MVTMRENMVAMLTREKMAAVAYVILANERPHVCSLLVIPSTARVESPVVRCEVATAFLFAHGLMDDELIEAEDLGGYQRRCVSQAEPYYMFC